MKPLIFHMAWRSLIGFCAVPGIACVWSGVAYAGNSASAMVASGDAVETAGWGATVSNERLDTVRGGFDTGTGLLASFGIERAVYVNGSLVTSTSVYIPNIGQMTAQQASALAAATSTLSVQNGTGNTIDPSALTQTTGGTAVQNTLNNQSVQTLTTLNATVNTLNLFKSLNLQSTLQSALINSLGH